MSPSATQPSNTPVLNDSKSVTSNILFFSENTPLLIKAKKFYFNFIETLSRCRTKKLIFTSIISDSLHLLIIQTRRRLRSSFEEAFPTINLVSYKFLIPAYQLKVLLRVAQTFAWVQPALLLIDNYWLPRALSLLRLLTV